MLVRTFVVILGLWAVSAAAPVALQEGVDHPVLEQKADVLQADLAAAALAYERRILERYKEREDRDGELDERVQEALEMGALWLAGATDAPSQNRVWNAVASLVVREGCDDPMVGAIYLQILIERGRRSARTLQEAVPIGEAMKASSYPAHRRSLALFLVGDLHTRHENKEEAEAAYASAAEAMVEALTDPELGVLEERYLYELMMRRMRVHPRVSGQALMDAIEANPVVNPWVREALAGHWHILLAWDARGTGWAREVTPEGWRGFRDHLRIARQRSTLAYELDPTRPEAPTSMITIVMAGQGDPEDTLWLWFNRAVAGQFDYERAYRHVLYALRPRWGGSHQAMLEFGRACAATERYDTIVPLQLFRAAQGISADLRDPDDIWRKPGLVEELAPVLEKTADHATDVATRVLYYSKLTGAAWHGGEYELARRALEGGVRPSRPATYFARVNAPVEQAIAETVLLGGPGAERYGAVRAAAAEGRWDRARELFDEIRPGHLEGEMIAPLRYLQAMYRMMDEFQRGKWTSCMPDSGHHYSGWTRLFGTWNPREGLALRGRPNDRGLMSLLDAPFGSRYEMRGTIDLSGLRDGWSGNAGFILDYHRDGRNDRFVSVRVLGATKRVSIARGFGVENAVPLPPAPDPEQPQRHTMHVRVWDNELVVRVNGKEVFAGVVPHMRARGDNGRVGLGGYYRWQGLGYVEFGDLEIRRLDERPEELPAPVEIEWEELFDLLPEGSEEGWAQAGFGRLR